MSIIYLGDIHGELRIFNHLRSIVEPNDIIIQVGDFGVSREILKEWAKNYSDYPCPVYFIDGNHENFDIIDSWDKTEVSEVASGLFYVPRGLVKTIQGQRIGFLGGGASIDKHWRIKGTNWFPQEVVSDQDIDTLLANVGEDPIDVLVTHVAPSYINLRHFGKLNLEEWFLPEGWIDHCAGKVEFVGKILNPPLHICGHMHRNIRDGNIKILDINEAWVPGYSS